MQRDSSVSFSAGLLPTIRMLMSASALEDVRAAIAHGAKLTSRYRTLSLYEAQRMGELDLTLRAGADVSADGVELEELLRGTVAKTGRTASTLDLIAGDRERTMQDEYAMRHGLCVAQSLVAYGSLTGVLVLHYDECIALPDSEFAALKRFVDFAAVALANARARDELVGYAYSDPLTGLGNRRHLEAELARLHEKRLALLLIDFDDLKAVNDALGYEQGDRLITSIGLRLTATARAGEVLVRLGGDEFVVILPDADPTRAAMRAEEMTAALDGLTLPGELQRLFHGASVGWATAEPGENPWNVLNRAAHEMRSRKRRRKSDRLVPHDGGALGARALDAVVRSRDD